MNSTEISDFSVQRSRSIEQQIVGQPTSDGAGVKLLRVLGQSLHTRLDPFLMLDAFKSDAAQDYIAGFPDHPHRGFETLTYLIAGRMRHHDNAGHQGLLETGGMQWMTAGRGIIHSEMPEQKEGRLEGFQLWLNLPAKEKMQPPSYLDVQSEAIAEFALINGGKARILAGVSHGVVGAIQRPNTQPLVVDLHLPAGAEFNQALPAAHNAFFYVYRGEIAVLGQTVAEQRLAVLTNSAEVDGVILQAQQASRVLLVAGQPLHEPIVQHGPFVMNSQAEILHAISDFNAGRLG